MHAQDEPTTAPLAAIRPARPPRVTAGPTWPRACSAAAVSRRTAPPRTATSTTKAAKRGVDGPDGSPRAAADTRRLRSSPGRRRLVAACTRRPATARAVTRACTRSRSMVLSLPRRVGSAALSIWQRSCRELVSGRDACRSRGMRAARPGERVHQAGRAERALTMRWSSCKRRTQLERVGSAEPTRNLRRQLVHAA